MFLPIGKKGGTGFRKESCISFTWVAKRNEIDISSAIIYDVPLETQLLQIIHVCFQAG